MQIRATEARDATEETEARGSQTKDYALHQLAH